MIESIQKRLRGEDSDSDSDDESIAHLSEDDGQVLPPSFGRPVERTFAASVGIHASHYDTLRTHSCWTWCVKCCNYIRGIKIRDLRRPCRAPTPAGQQALTRIKAGRPPCLSVLQWNGRTILYHSLRSLSLSLCLSSTCLEIYRNLRTET